MHRERWTTAGGYYISVKEVKHMRLTITLTLGRLMFQFIVRSKNRHSAK